MKKCCIPYCRNEASKGRYCARCASRKWRSENKLEAAYHALKTNAKRRGVSFTITMSEWRRWCEEHNYKPVGKSPASPYPEFRSRPSVDRIDHKKGYSYENMQLLTVSCNSSKGYNERNGVSDNPF